MTTYRESNIEAAYQRIHTDAQPGDEVVLASGEYDVGAIPNANTGNRYTPILNPANNGVTVRADGDGVILRNSNRAAPGQPMIGGLNRDGIRLEGHFCIDERNARACPDTGPVVFWSASNFFIESVELYGLNMNDPDNFGDNHNLIRLEHCQGGQIRNVKLRRHHQAGRPHNNGAAIMAYAATDIFVDNLDAEDVDAVFYIKGAPDPDGTGPLPPVPNQRWHIRNLRARDVLCSAVHLLSAWDVLLEGGDLSNCFMGVSFGQIDAGATSPKRIICTGQRFTNCQYDFYFLGNQYGGYEDIRIERYPNVRIGMESPNTGFLTVVELAEPAPTPEPTPPPPAPAPVPVLAPTYTGGQFRVFVDGEQTLNASGNPTYYTQEKEAYENAGRAILNNPTSEVIVRTDDVRVELS